MKNRKLDLVDGGQSFGGHATKLHSATTQNTTTCSISPSASLR